jgi:hypothetical protein
MADFLKSFVGFIFEKDVVGGEQNHFALLFVHLEEKFNVDA